MMARTDDATRNGCTPMSIRRATAEGASFVCSVLKTRWPVRLALIAMFAVSKIANLANHDDVRRLAQDRAERRGKRHADFRIHLHLIDAGHLIFHRLFDGDDLCDPVC